MNIDLTQHELEVVVGVLAMQSAYTEREMLDHLGWTDRDRKAWASALNKTDSALTYLKGPFS